MKTTPTQTLLTTLAMAAILLISACKKDDATNVSHLVATLVETTTGGPNQTQTDVYIYDNQGRVIKIDREFTDPAVSPETYQYVFTYGSNTVTETVTGASSWSEVYDLNAQGYYSNGGLNLYDSDGRMTVQKIGDSSSYLGTEVTYQGGNAIQGKAIVNDTVKAVFDYTYYTGKEDTRDYGNNWQYGEGSKNLVQTITSGGVTTNCTYEFDAYGRVTKETSGPWSNGTGTGVTKVRTFTYAQ